MHISTAVTGIVLLTTALAQAADVNLRIEGLASTEGRVMVALFDQPSSFPRGKFKLANMVEATKGGVTTSFKDLAPGKYAVSAYHDVNGNQRLDANMVGLPTEPYGFSRDARGTMGPPKFDDAVFTVGVDPVNLTVQLK